MEKKDKLQATSTQDGRSSLVKSVERAIILLNALADQHSGLTLTELCERVGFNISTAHRLLATLSRYDYVRQESRSKIYRLGFQLLKVGQAAREQLDLRDEVMQDLESLVNDVHELANLVIPTGHEVTIIAQINGRASQGGIQIFAQLGERVPLYCTAVGKCILAYMPKHELDSVLDQVDLVAHTPNTITNIFQLQEELNRVRCNGYAIDNEEREIGIRCVGSPIWDGTERVIAAISISAPSGRIVPREYEKLGPIVAKAAQKISRRLGYKGDFQICHDETD